MPGKHAPASSRSFLVSLATAIGGALAALGVVVGITLVALNAGSDNETEQNGGPAIQSSTPAASSPTPTETATASPSPTETTAGVTPAAQVTLRVLNGSGRPGQAAAMAARAKEAGYPEAKLGNTSRTAKSTIFYRADSKEEAEAFQQTFSEFTEIAPAPSSFASDVMLTIVIGLDYPVASPTATSS
jgi:hypothetical protein